MDSNNIFSQPDLSRELHNFHDELEAYNEVLNDSNTRRVSQSPVELSIFQSNFHIQEKQLYEKKMEFLSDEKFFQNRSEKKSNIIQNLSNVEEAKTVHSDNFDIKEGSKTKKEQKGLLKRSALKFYGKRKKNVYK